MRKHNRIVWLSLEIDGAVCARRTTEQEPGAMNKNESLRLSEDSV